MRRGSADVAQMPVGEGASTIAMGRPASASRASAARMASGARRDIGEGHETYRQVRLPAEHAAEIGIVHGVQRDGPFIGLSLSGTPLTKSWPA